SDDVLLFHPCCGRVDVLCGQSSFEWFTLPAATPEFVQKIFFVFSRARYLRIPFLGPSQSADLVQSFYNNLPYFTELFKSLASSRIVTSDLSLSPCFVPGEKISCFRVTMCFVMLLCLLCL